MKVFITKYALTQGIYEAEVSLDPAVSPYRVYEVGEPNGYNLNRDAFTSREDAEDQARLMATRKLRALDSQRGKLLLLAATPKWRAVAKERP